MMFWKVLQLLGVWILLVSSLGARCQEPGGFVAEGVISGWNNKPVYLLSYYGERRSLMDSVVTGSDGSFRFRLSSGLATGMYRLHWGTQEGLDLIFNQESIRLSTDATHPVDSLQILSSDENKLYYAYLTLDRRSQLQLEVLQQVLDYYPVRDSFYAHAGKEYVAIQERLQAFLDSVGRGQPTAYAASVIRLYQTPFIPLGLAPDMRMMFLKQHYFDQVDFQDTALLRSNAWANKAITFLGLFSNPRMGQKQLEAEFIKAVTILLSAASQNEEIFAYLLDYLVMGFDKFHFEDVITYIAENFEDPRACENADRKSALQKKLETFKKIAIGKPAPPLNLTLLEGGSFTLAGLDAEYTLLLFWSSECGHCITMMPEVLEIYHAQKPKRMEIVAVSIDTSRVLWREAVETIGMDWINASDLKGFDGAAADDFNIYATPTMFLLDRSKTILAKPISYRELEVVLRENGLR